MFAIITYYRKIDSISYKKLLFFIDFSKMVATVLFDKDNIDFLRS